MRRKRVAIAAAAVALLGAGAALGFVLYERQASRNVRGSSSVEFVPTTVPTTTAAPTVPSRPALTIDWPTYGYDNQRLRSVESSLRPPLRSIWTFRASTLVEFPPAVGYGRLYFANNSGTLFAVNAATGKQAWAYRSGRCVASSPALAHGAVFQTFMNLPPCNSTKEGIDGEVIAFGAGFGKIRWRARIGPTESSPLVANGLVYVGDWRRKIYALDERTGEVRWSYETGDKVKGAAALADGRIFIGSYDGHVYALDARTGKLAWRASSQERLGGSGTFYSTPAVAYGRVYIGSTDGKVYSFGAASGQLRWSQGTGGYVYASPAIWRQLVLVGSYSGRFYALDAATGDVRWQFDANGPISGSATVLGDVVYFSTLKERTYALAAATGRLLWTWSDGKYSPVVADSKRVYLVGYARVYGMVEKQ